MSYAVANLLVTVIDLYWWVLLASVVISWLVAFDVLNMRSNVAYQIWKAINALTEPLLAPIRNILPPFGGLDMSPLILLLVLQFVRDLVISSTRGGLSLG